MIEGEVGCEHCHGSTMEEVCPLVNDPDVPCEPMWLFYDDMSAMCPYCGCEVGVSCDGEESAYATHDWERPCPPRVWPW